MRTTITFDEEAAEILRVYSESQGISLSKAASNLVVQGARPKSWIKYKDGFPVFDLEPGPTITDEHIRKLVREEF